MEKNDSKSPGFRFLDSTGLAAEAAREEREMDAACPWKVNAETLVLYIEAGGDRSYYEIDLEKCGSSAGVLDWIAQVSQKTWIDDATLGSLVRKLDRLFDLQGTMCGGGKSREIKPAEYLRKAGRLK